MKKLALATSLLLSFNAHAAFVEFWGPLPAQQFADGTFSSHLSGTRDDGFCGGSTGAFNCAGQNGEYILFNKPVVLNSLWITEFGTYTAKQVNINLYGGSTLLASQSVFLNDFDGVWHNLVFNTAGVTKLQFNFVGGADFYQDGNLVGWYRVESIKYNEAVPVPAAAWLFGSGLIGLVATARKRKAN